MKVGDITAALEVFAPLRIQEEWDNSGLLIGSANDQVHGVLVGFDCTPELIDEAVEKGCDMVVTHHPLIFKGIKSLEQNIDHMYVNLDLAVANFGEYVLHVMRKSLHPLEAHSSRHTL